MSMSHTKGEAAYCGGAFAALNGTSAARAGRVGCGIVPGVDAGGDNGGGGDENAKKTGEHFGRYGCSVGYILVRGDESDNRELDAGKVA